MPRIRKKTSNRGTTNQRKRILGKVRESRKKAKKAAKKNPQWKSKTPKDPGIPNNFPFKDQILAEVSEQRRIDAEEKQRKKEERKGSRAKAAEGNLEEDGSEGIGAQRVMNAKVLARPTVQAHANEPEEEEVPVLINHDLPNLKAVLDESDVVIQVLDARDPLSFRSSHLDELIAAKPGRHTLLILNKIDACPRESVAAWASYLRTQHPTLLFRSASAFLPGGPELPAQAKGKAKANLPSNDGLGVDPVLSCLNEWASEKKSNTPLTVAVLGVTNTGKSSFINTLLRKRTLPVYTLATSSRGPTTTELPQEVIIGEGDKQIRLIDTPGLSWEFDRPTEDDSEESESEEKEVLDDHRTRDILTRSKGRIDRLKDPTSAVTQIVSRSNTEDLMLFYGLAAFAKGDATSFLSGVARSHQLIKRKGDLDLIGASRLVLRDWSSGKLSRYAVPPKTSATVGKLPSADEKVLEALATRKEMRKDVGLVKISSGEIESRKVIIDEPWVSLGGDTDSVGSEDDMEVDNGGDNDNDEDDVKENDVSEGDGPVEDEEEDVPQPISNKQKRKRANDLPTAPPSKKVTFAPGPKPAAKRKIANVAPKNKSPVATSGARSDEAYDFGKFF